MKLNNLLKVFNDKDIIRLGLNKETYFIQANKDTLLKMMKKKSLSNPTVKDVYIEHSVSFSQQKTYLKVVIE